MSRHPGRTAEGEGGYTESHAGGGCEGEDPVISAIDYLLYCVGKTGHHDGGGQTQEYQRG